MESDVLKTAVAGLRQQKSRLAKPQEFPRDSTAVTRRNFGGCCIRGAVKSFSEDSASDSNS